MSDRLILAAAELHSAAGPIRWNEFVAALKAHAEHRYEQCVSSSPENVSVAQGMAREAREILNLVSTCRVHAEKIRSKGKHKMG